MHGWAIARRIQQVSDDLLRVQQGSLYPALHRLEHQGWITAEWGASENNRRARFYSLTKAGRKQLTLELSKWERLSTGVDLVLQRDLTMRLWHILHTRLRSLFFRERRESDLREELQFHLERETERLEAAGVRPDAARLQALRTFGAVEPTKEACRDARGTVLVDSLVRDLRFACRSFRRAPLVALTIVTTVGLGLGLVAPCSRSSTHSLSRWTRCATRHELFAVERQRSAGAQPEAFTRAQYDALVRETDVFSDAFASRHGEALIEGRRMEGPLVTGNFFQVLGVSAARGRTLTRRTTNRAALRSLSSAIGPGPGTLRAIPACSIAPSG
jgi:PadR family transcriptional regulator, regulatory protein PadR